VDVLDFHLRLGPAPRAVDAVIDCLDRSGIRRAVLCAGGLVDGETLSERLRSGAFSTVEPDNEAVAEAAEKHRQRFRACWFGNPHGGLDRYRSDGGDFVGLELSPAVHGVPLSDPRTYAFAEAAAHHGHWVYVVCINRVGCDVDSLVALAGRFPDVIFVLGHLGYGNIDYHGMRLVAPAGNVLVESSGGYSSVLAYAVRRLGAHRVLFGSEFPLQDPAVELTKVKCAGLSEDAVRAVLHDNAERLTKGAWQ
jgi:predicted TIM-barrel fold metal-dependent hydrolase